MSKIAKIVQDPPVQEPLDLSKSMGWVDWFMMVTRALNRQVNRTVISPTVGASPWVYQANYSGDSRMTISGGTISALEISKDGVTYYPINPSTGLLQMSQGEFMRVTYSVAPSINIIPN